jgi:hypothetical protein
VIERRDLRLSGRRNLRLRSSGLRHHIILYVVTNVLDKFTASSISTDHNIKLNINALSLLRKRNCHPIMLWLSSLNREVTNVCVKLLRKWQKWIPWEQEIPNYMLICAFWNHNWNFSTFINFHINSVGFWSCQKRRYRQSLWNWVQISHAC